MAQLSRRDRRNIFGLFALCALPLGVAGFFAYLEADPEIQLPPRPKLPDPNGFDLYLQAAKLTAQPNPPVDPSSDLDAHTLTAPQGAQRYSRARREAWNRGAAPGWAMFERAQRAQTRVPTQPGETDSQPLIELRKLGRAKIAQANLGWMRGERDAAVAAALDAIELGLDLSDGSSFIDRLVADSIVNMGLSAFNNRDRWPEKLTAPQARAALARLQTLAPRHLSWANTVDAERWWQLALLRDTFESGQWRDEEERVLGERDDSLRSRVSRRLTSKRTVVSNINRMANHAIAALKEPYSPHQIEPPTGLDLISEQSWIYGNVGFAQAYGVTQLDLLMLRFALQAHVLERGVYPSQLSQLQGAYLQRIPTDDFAGGKPYNYEVKDGHYRLWSVGPDAVNDGGQAIGFTAGLSPVSNKDLPSVHSDSKGDVVAGETR